jgi:hypothetical protein
MQANYSALLDRLPAHSKTASIRKAVEAALAVKDRYAARQTEMAQSGKFTESGLSAALRDILPATIRSLQTAKAPIAALKREIKSKRDELRRPPERDKTDLAGAIEQGEIRNHFRSLKPGEREALLMSTTDLRLVEAAIAAPPELSGFSANDRDVVEKIEARYTALKHPNEVAELEILDELVASAEAITTVARNGLRDAAQLDTRTFEREAAKIEAAVWIVGEAGREQVCEPGPDGTATYRPATADEVATGVRYANIGEYQSARAA